MSDFDDETGNKAVVVPRYEIAANMLRRWIKEYEEGKFVGASLDGVTA